MNPSPTDADFIHVGDHGANNFEFEHRLRDSRLRDSRLHDSRDQAP